MESEPTAGDYLQPTFPSNRFPAFRSLGSTFDQGYGSESTMSSSDILSPPLPQGVAESCQRWSLAKMENLEEAKQKPQKRHKTFPGRNDEQSFPTPEDVRQISVAPPKLCRAPSPLIEDNGTATTVTTTRRPPQRTFSYEAGFLKAFSRSKETNIDGDIDEETTSEDEGTDEAFLSIPQRESFAELPSPARSLSPLCPQSFSVPASPHPLLSPPLSSPSSPSRTRSSLRPRSQSPRVGASATLPRVLGRTSLREDDRDKENSNLLVPESSVVRTKSYSSVLEDEDENGVDITRSRSTDFLAEIGLGRERKYSTIEAGFPTGPVPAAATSLRRSLTTKTGPSSLGSLFRRFRPGGSFRAKSGKKSSGGSLGSSGNGGGGDGGFASTVLLNPWNKEKKGHNSSRSRRTREEIRSQSIPEPIELHGPNSNGLRRFSDCPVPPSSFNSSANDREQSIATASRVSVSESVKLCLVDWEEKLCAEASSAECLPTIYAGVSWEQATRAGITETILIEKMIEKERKLKAALWEIARNECEYLEGLLVLKDVYKATLEFLQEKEYLLYVNKDLLFANLDDICQVSSSFAKSLLGLFVDKLPTEAGNLREVCKMINEMTNSLLATYKIYCLNYKKMKCQDLLKWWKQCSGFPIYEQSCVKNLRAKKRSIDDLLITPFTRLTRYVPLLDVVFKYCCKEDEKIVQETIEEIKLANRALDDELRSLDEFEIVFELQRNLVWPTVTDTEKAAEIPLVLAEMLSPSHQGCNFFLANGERNIIFYRPVILKDSATEMYLFLFDDLILLTTFKPNCTGSQRRASFSNKLPNGTYTVFKEPLPLDRIKIVDVSNCQGWDKCFSIIHYSRFVQVLGVYTFQAISDLDKNDLVKEIAKTQKLFKKT